jgi:hypothetical protein
LDELDGRAVADDLRGAGLEHAPEPVADPSATLRWRLQGQLPSIEFQRLQRREPDPIGGLVDGQRKLGLHARPYVLELGAHGSVNSLLSQEENVDGYSEEGPWGPGQATITDVLAALHRLVATAEKITARAIRSYTSAPIPAPRLPM